MPDMEIMGIEIPKYLDNLQLPDPNLLTYYKNLENRTFWIDTEIGDDLLEISKKIIEFNRADKDIPIAQRKPIKIAIHTPGGLLDATMSLVGICELSKTPIYTYNVGIAFSAGLLILLAGHKRYCLPGSRIMIHSGSGGAAGTFEQVESATNDYKKLIAQMREYIIRRTNITPQVLGKRKANDWYLYTEDQIKYGIVDEILTDLDVLL